MTDEELYSATYCENCGQVIDESDEIVDELEEPVHRVEIIEAIGDFDDVVEMTAEELENCECTGQIVQRYYIKNMVEHPEVEYEPDPEEITGRDPDEDALIDMSGEGEDWQEVREVLGLDEGTEEQKARMEDIDEQ